MLLVGCTESKTQTFNVNSDSLLNKTELVNIELTNWDRSEHLLIGSDSNWVKENITEKNVALLFSHKSYISQDALKYIIKFVLEHSSDEFTSSEVDAQKMAVIVHLYDVNGTKINFVFQKEKSINYIEKFIRYLSVSEYKNEYDVSIRRLMSYDSLLER